MAFDQQQNHLDRVLYLKGGSAFDDGERLIPLRGKVIKGGPDQFFLTILSIVGVSRKLRVVTFGKEYKQKLIENVELYEYAEQKKARNLFHRLHIRISTIISFVSHAFTFKPTTIVCGLDGPNGFAALCVAKVLAVPFVFSVHNAIFIPQVSKLYRLCNHFLVKYSDSIVTHGEFLTQQVSEKNINTSKVFEYAATIDDEELGLINKYNAAKSASSDNKPKRIVYIGRLEKDKGVFDLLEAFKLVDSTSLELTFVGGGGALASLKQLVEQYDLTNRVQVVGQVKYQDIYKFLCEADVLIAPSQSKFPEGRCKSIVEAFIAGIPAIGPDYGPFPFLIKHGVNGFLYKADDQPDLANKISMLLNNESLKKLTFGAVNSGKDLMKAQSFDSALKKSIEFISK